MSRRPRHPRPSSTPALRAPGAAAPLRAPHGDVVRHVLPSGLRVLIWENHLAPVVALQAWVDVGAADEASSEEGIAHVFEHMLFKGTTRRGVAEIAREVEAAGGEINAWTSHDQTVYHLVLASRFFATGVDVLADALQRSSFDAEELDRELKVILEEIKQNEDSPARRAARALFQKSYSRHPYRRPVIGDARAVRRIRREQLLAFFRRWYAPANITLVVAGDVDRHVATDAIERAFQATGRSGAPDHPAHREPPQRTPRSVVVAQDVREAHLALGFHIPGLCHADTGALDVLALVLGQGDSSRLNLRVRRRQLVTDCVAYSHTPKGPGLLVVSAALPPDGLEAAARALCEETLRLAHEEVTSEEIAKAQAMIESDGVYQRETVQGMSRKLGFFETAAGSLDYEEEYRRQVADVTPARMREVAARYLSARNATFTALVPEGKSTQRLEARLVEILRSAEDAVTPVPRLRTAFRAHPARDGVLRDTLPSGLRLLVKRDASVPLVALRAVWLGGLLREDDRTNGINNLLAELLTQGTAAHGAEEIAREVEGLAGSLAGFSGRNSFGLRAELLARHLDRGLEIFAECLTEPAFSADELAKERTHVLAELRAQADNLPSLAFRLFAERLYPRGPYRLDVIGTRQSVRALTSTRMAAYYRRHYAPADMVLAVVGDVDPDRIHDFCSDAFHGAAGPRRRARGAVAAARRTGRSDVLRQGGPHLARRVLPRQQVHLVVGYPGTTLTDPDRFALEVLSTVLSGQSGRLFVELRDKRSLAYQVSAYSLEGVDPGYFAVYLSCGPEKAAAARAAIEAELARLRHERISAAELARAQRYLVGAHDIALQRRGALASSLAFNECYGVGWDEHVRYAPAILSVTAEDVRRVARRTFDRSREVVAVVGPDVKLGSPSQG